jgi:AcrR family transcriptional regulator
MSVPETKCRAGARAGRGAATRERILDAVVRSVDEAGFARTTSQRIARCAGVSVGAVQHHFPAKNDILAAVLERSFESLAARFEGAPLAGAPLEARVEAFVDRAWQHYGSAAFRSTLEILLNARDLAADAGAGTAAAPILHSARSATALWSSLFGDVTSSARRQRELRSFAFAALAGLAVTRRLQPATAGMGAPLALLKDSLLALFSAERDRPTASGTGPRESPGRGPARPQRPPAAAIRAHASRSVTVRLNTGAPGAESGSTQK